MTAIKKVAVAGAAGKIGRHILTRLLGFGLFEVTILSREGFKHDFPPSLVVKIVNYGAVASLQDALRGQDAVVSAIAFEAIEVQKNLIIAAEAAGVRRIIPSEYGNDTMNPKLATIPIYEPKIAIRQLLQHMVKANPNFSWTVIMNASFLGPDWTLAFIVDVKERKCDIKDGGDILFAAATYDDIAQAVVGILTHLDETANRPVKISSYNTTQNEIIGIAKELGAVDGWDITHSNTDELEVVARERWNRGDRSEEVIAMFINRAFLGKNWGGYFPVLDNQLLGIKGLDRKEMIEIVRKAMEG